MNGQKNEKKSNPFIRKTGMFFFSGWRLMIHDLMRVVDIDFKELYGPRKALALFVLPFIAFWFIYVPVHEFLHVAGCWAAGGTVTELQIDPMYGGKIFEKFVPFVVAGGDYAGRLSGFDPGSDLGYLLTDFGPFFLSLLGVPWLLFAMKRKSLIMLGPALILAVAPFLNLLGDYHEMGFIISTDISKLFVNSETFDSLIEMRKISDDFIKLVSNVTTYKAFENLGIAGIAPVLILSSFFAVVLAGWTYRLSDYIAFLFGMKPAEIRIRLDEEMKKNRSQSAQN